MMPNLRLIVPPRALDDALSSDPEYNEAMSSEDWARLASAIQRVLERTPLTASPESPRDPWGGYFAVDEDTQEVVGSCAFKTPPTAEGTVEIAYFTYPPFEGRGYATEMARQLVEMATHAGAVGSVLAHTLPEPSASTRVLEKTGMDSRRGSDRSGRRAESGDGTVEWEGNGRKGLLAWRHRDSGCTMS